MDTGDGPKDDFELGGEQDVCEPFRPLEIIQIAENHSFELDTRSLEEVLCAPEVQDLPVAVVSVAGAFRKGKSFLLDFFIRYLRAGGEEGWEGDADSVLEGFHWRGGSDRDTTGILMWSEPFVVETPKFGKVAVLLLDTQGTFDSSSTVKDCATVFALSTMLASCQIYNISQNIQEDDLQHLQLFTEYGALALAETHETPFQRLLFLVRDWSFAYEHAFGLTGGNDLLQKRLEVSEKQADELQRVRKHIKTYFQEIDCFLMPHPGLEVATNPTFKGELRDISQPFMKHLRDLAPQVLAADSITPKMMNGSALTCADLLHYFIAFTKVFQGDDLPTPMSIIEATAEANNLAALNKAKQHYNDEMEATCGGHRPYQNPEKLHEANERVTNECLVLFHSVKKMGGFAFSESYVTQLDEYLMQQYSQYKEHNASKNLFRELKTPGVLFVIMAVLYMTSGFVNLIGITSFAQFFSVLFYAVLVALLTWVYTKFSGSYSEVGVQIDEFAGWCWKTYVTAMRTMHEEKRAEKKTE